MMTPQEVSEFAFPKASFGGYNMASVDEFLDQLTADYTALYKDNASLKAKMKVLADSLEEYRATEKGMRRALLAAQQTADEMVKEAEARKAELLRNAEADAQVRINELHRQVADEEARLASARAATTDYVNQVRACWTEQEKFLDSLDSITAAAAPVAPASLGEDTVTRTALDIEESVQKLLVGEESEAEPQPTSEEDTARGEELTFSRRDQERARAFEEEPTEKDDADSAPTRRIDFDNLQFGSNYDLK